ncbi:hypothetical protein [Algibacter sp. PT7-4]|uniref:hypothetical protein n=1 Tax=Algibacter ulvanivorans TaxID=3400999 RepID=UPI003AAC6435
MPGTIILNLPLKPYLKKYLTQKYGDTHCVSRRSWLGRYLIDILDKNYRKANTNISKEDYYSINIPASIIKEVGFDISATKLKHLSEMVHKVFLNDLYSYIEVSVGSNLKFYNDTHNSTNNQNTLRAISQFLKFYNISEDEISPDSIYRTFYRDRKSNKSKPCTKHQILKH